ncbi:hypothetical protein HOLleu_24474 [Holothuria leucospilota]|uniref:Tesmin/TSO1-like CXC domain-containing protein n=1 Tax=Holothuria leucospilota TaxID=206669 RepID=A0A9Q1BWR8_HOLLE|nr:hypothetical protein HOLleu_24474 [Holothuria leucospilota]
MTQVQALLMFIAATRKGDWKLHLATTEDLLPYFHAHDQYNYGRWRPLYVADMLELQTTDPELWKFFEEGNFIITKHEIPFTGIDPDHAIEQEHRKIKAKGGFVGLTGNEAALAKYAIIAPSLARIVQEFKKYAGIQGRQPSTLHHETVGEKSTQMIKYAADVVDVITKQGNPFMQSDMFNLVTYAVTPAEVAKNIEDRDNLGREALEKFVSSRMIEHTTGFWDSQKNNITFFKDVRPVTKAKMKGQLVTVKQERRLLSQLLVVAKSRPEFEVKDAIGEYEFSNTPPSNCHPDGSMIMLSGKFQLVRLIMDLPLPDNVQEPTSEDSTGSTKEILIIDAMCIVNMVTKSPNEKFRASDFATKFLDIIINLSSPYDEVRIVFDQYLLGSLKETTRDNRTKKSTSIHYHVNNSTEIRNVKSFLAHIKTKAELTEYLADKILCHYKDSTKKVVVMHHTSIMANCDLPDVISMPEMLDGRHTLEEGDQLVILNAFDVNCKDPTVKLDIFSVDTDLFKLLTGCYPLLPHRTTLKRKQVERLSIWESYQKLGKKRAEALIGWYAFKGTGNTGTFAGKGVSSHFRAFLQCDDTTLDAFAVFGSTKKLPHWILREMERYVCLLYSTGSTKFQSTKELRWMLFAKNGKEGRQLPPTLGTLKPHTERSFFMALVWKTSCKPCPCIPAPTEYSWKLVDGQLIPILCTNPPAPEPLLELRRCSCRGSCGTNRCGCKRNLMACTDACKCSDGCKNTEDLTPEIKDDDELLG